MSPDAVALMLGQPDPETTRALIGNSNVDRFEDLEALQPVVRLVDGCEAHARALDGLIEAIAAVGPQDPRLGSPILRGWLFGFGQIEAPWSVDNARLLQKLDAIDNMRFSLDDPEDFEGLFAIQDGVLMTWDARLAVGGLKGEVAFASRVGRRLAIKTDAEQILSIDLDDLENPSVLSAPRLPETNIVVRNDLPMLRVTLSDERLPQREGGIVWDVFDSRPQSYAPFDAVPFLEAAHLVSVAWPEEFEDWRLTLRVVVPREAPPGLIMQGMTSASYQGACWIAARGFPNVLDALVHEQSHIKLRYIEATQPILEPMQPRGPFRVGWRDDPRPIDGILEGVYVNLHVCEAFARVGAAGLLTSEAAAGLAERGREHLDQVKAALTLLTEHAWFTEPGWGFIDYARARIDWLDQLG